MQQLSLLSTFVLELLVVVVYCKTNIFTKPIHFPYLLVEVKAFICRPVPIAGITLLITLRYSSKHDHDIIAGILSV
jgi:hypothetical protein